MSTDASYRYERGVDLRARRRRDRPRAASHVGDLPPAGHGRHRRVMTPVWQVSSGLVCRDPPRPFVGERGQTWRCRGNPCALLSPSSNASNLKTMLALPFLSKTNIFFVRPLRVHPPNGYAWRSGTRVCDETHSRAQVFRRQATPWQASRVRHRVFLSSQCPLRCSRCWPPFPSSRSPSRSRSPATIPTKRRRSPSSSSTCSSTTCTAPRSFWCTWATSGRARESARRLATTRWPPR